MKLLSLCIICIFFLCYSSCSQNNSGVDLKDGIYLVVRTGTDSTRLDSLRAGHAVISFNHEMIKDDPQAVTRLVIDAHECVALELEKQPETEQQTAVKKKLLLSLTPDAAKNVKSFTTRNLNRQVVIVVGGEAITMHKIRAVIDGGTIQITRCNDNACETLYTRLKNNVRK
jgi:hypothetical protein